jgi:hypothetical protein
VPVELSPFPHQGPLQPDQVRGRDDLIAELIERLTERRVTALVGPRRYGKTSVLRRVAADLAAEVSVIWIDLYEVTSESDLAVRLDTALHGAVGPVRGRLARIAASAELDLGVLKLRLARRRSERPDPAATLHILLDTLVAAVLDHPSLVVIDEFPGIVRVEGAAGLLRTKLQHHFQELGLVFAGSQPSLMRTMFTETTMPFYAQADLVAVAPFSLAAITDIVETGFSATGRDPGDLAARIHTFTGGHPHRSMQLADAAWRHTDPATPYRAETWESAIESVRADTELANESVFSRFSNSEKTVLRLVASEHGLFGAASELLGLSSGQAQNARDALVAAGDLTVNEQRTSIVDPVLADWVRRRLPA